MPKIMVEVDGEMVPLTDLDWCYRRSCGCLIGAMVARVIDEDEAWHEYLRELPNLSRKPVRLKEIRKRKAAGYTMTLEPIANVVKDMMGPACAHD